MTQSWPHGAQRRRNRLRLAAVLALTIAAGLSTRASSLGLPDVIALNAGDALWTVAVYLCFALLVPSARPATLAVLALSTSIAVELSQLSQASWLTATRSTRVGGLVLGHGFLWVDLLRYCTGALIALAVDLARQALQPSTSESPSPVE